MEDKSVKSHEHDFRPAAARGSESSRTAAFSSARLDAEEAAALSEALRGIPGEVWLFGSRADPARRGGDIDLLVLTDQPAFDVSRAVATRFFSRCEERIDVIVMDPARLTPEQSDFLARIGRKVRLS